MSGPKVTERDEELIFRLRTDDDGNRRGCRAIADILREQHGRDLNYATVSRVLKARADERQEIAQEVTREKLQGVLGGDIGILQEVLDHELDVFRAGKPGALAATAGGAPYSPLPAWVRLGGEIRDLVTYRIKLSGADPDATARDELSTVDDAELEAEIERQRAIAACAPPGPGAGEGEAGR